jgi:hypothetical protein
MSDDSNIEENWQERAEAAEAALGRVQADVNAKLIRAELKAEAIRAGMVDLDGLKLLNMDDVRLTEAGDVADATVMLAKLKRAKPWLFVTAASSSAAANPPRPEAPRARHANELTHEEWLSARASLVRRR